MLQVLHFQRLNCKQTIKMALYHVADRRSTNGESQKFDTKICVRSQNRYTTRKQISSFTLRAAGRESSKQFISKSLNHLETARCSNHDCMTSANQARRTALRCAALHGEMSTHSGTHVKPFALYYVDWPAPHLRLPVLIDYKRRCLRNAAMFQVDD